MGPPLGCGVFWSSKVKLFVEPELALRHKGCYPLRGLTRQGRDFPASQKGQGALS